MIDVDGKVALDDKVGQVQMNLLLRRWLVMARICLIC